MDQRDRRSPRRVLRGRQRPHLRPAHRGAADHRVGLRPKALELAGRIGDGCWGSSPTAGLVDGFRENGGTEHLPVVVDGGSFTTGGRLGSGRRFLGWSVGPHWLLPSRPARLPGPPRQQ